MNTINKVIVPVDFSSHTDKVVAYALSVADQLSAHVIFLHVSETFAGYETMLAHASFDKLVADMKKDAQERIESMIEAHQSIKGGCSGAAVSGDIVEKIITFAAENKADLIIIGTHGAKGIEKILMGSVAKRVVKRAPCPVLTFNPCTSDLA